MFVVHVKAKNSLFLFKNWGLPVPYCKPTPLYIECVCTYFMNTYGIYGSHTTEACPLYNTENRRLLLNIAESFETIAKKHDINIKEQYHSGLEHTFIWVAEANNARLIEDLMIESRVAKFNTLKIVPLRTLQNVVESLKKLEQSEA